MLHFVPVCAKKFRLPWCVKAWCPFGRPTAADLTCQCSLCKRGNMRVASTSVARICIFVLQSLEISPVEAYLVCVRQKQCMCFTMLFDKRCSWSPQIFAGRCMVIVPAVSSSLSIAFVRNYSVDCNLQSCKAWLQLYSIYHIDSRQGPCLKLGFLLHLYLSKIVLQVALGAPLCYPHDGFRDLFFRGSNAHCSHLIKSFFHEDAVLSPVCLLHIPFHTIVASLLFNLIRTMYRLVKWQTLEFLFSLLLFCSFTCRASPFTYIKSFDTVYNVLQHA